MGKLASWRTLLAGVCASLGQLLEASEDSRLRVAGNIITAIGLALLGAVARDNVVTSQDAGAK